ncbi:MAG: cytochrome c1 [Pseudomonadota bacterium]
MLSSLRTLIVSAAVAGTALLTGAPVAIAAGEAPSPPSRSWTFSGPFGTFDNAQLQRGFQVYKQSCSACHGMRLLYYRNLGQPGGPEFTEDEVKVIAAGYMVTDGPDDTGEMFQRPAIPSDTFFEPYENEQQARSIFGGAYPVDLSVITKARKYGPNYLAALLLGYHEAPAGFDLEPGQYYNEYYSGHRIAMPPPLVADGQIAYDDDTPETIENYAVDVSAFLHWAGEPKLEERKRIGLQVMIFLFVFAALLYLTKLKLWRNIDH